jgi:hypothetical protein
VHVDLFKNLPTQTHTFYECSSDVFPIKLINLLGADTCATSNKTDSRGCYRRPRTVLICLVQL